MGFFSSRKSSTAVLEPTFDAGTSATDDVSGEYTLDVTPLPPRLLGPPRDGHHRPRRVPGLRGHRDHRHREPRQPPGST